ncbi:MAG: pyridoxal phosphate-dependent aminotransferase [Candidatus Aenigmarchaeota archaeon]|nr:pyridoxal phosphate-dependent aminotransferase [Candidatus Aenigmarchaeota archaeon]
MKIDQRIKQLKLGIRRIADLASQKPDCIRLDIGQPDFDTPEHIKQAAIDALKEGFTGYTSSYGISELRGAIAERESEKVPNLNKNNVLVSSGGAGALTCSFLSFLKPEDEVIIPDPYWGPYVFQIVSSHGKPIPINYFSNGKIDADKLEKSITKKTKIILVNSPENPTGRVYTKKDLEEIADIANNHDLLVISDEVYDKLIFGDAKHLSIASMIPEKTLLVNSCSKTYAMTGWRVGWLVGKEEYISEIMKCNRATIACPTSFAQKAAYSALTGDQSCVEEMRKKYEERRDVAVEEFGKLGLEFVKPYGAFYTFPNIGRDSWKFALELLDQRGVSVVPGDAFGSSGKEHIRVALTVDSEKIKEGIEKIGEFLK